LSPPRYVNTPGQPLIALQTAVSSKADAGEVFPAFALSGDYIVQGEFDIGPTHYVCTQKIQVRAPGIRAELCWDSVGVNDVDLHFSRLQGVSCPTHGWDDVCPSGLTVEDCYYGSGCAALGTPGWGYVDSAASACIGWGSERTLGACTNPRLDLDNVSCDRTINDPTQTGPGNFCSPENINLDDPNDGDAFAVGVNFYNGTGAHPHVDLYCDGQRLLSAGYNPATGQTAFPDLRISGSDSSGDFWNVATVTAHVSGSHVLTCDIGSVPAHHADPTRDGTNPGSFLCVESTTNQSTPAFSYTTHAYVESGSQQGLPAGSIPGTAAQWCKH